MKQSRINAAYHFLGLLFFIIPIVGLAAPALFSVFRKFPSLEERNHYRGVLNFLTSVFIYFIASYFLFPGGVSFVVNLIITVLAAMMVIYNGVLALQGEECSYPLSLPILKPEVKRTSIDDLMLQSRE